MMGLPPALVFLGLPLLTLSVILAWDFLKIPITLNRPRENTTALALVEEKITTNG